MNRFLPYLLGIVSLALFSCTGTGNLRITNKTSADIWVSVDDGTTTVLRPNETISESYHLTDSFVEAETRSVKIEYEGYHLFADIKHVDVKPNSTTRVSLNADGGGIKINNDILFIAISQVYISPSTSSMWGANVLSEQITYGESGIWTVTPGLWDVKIVSSLGTTFYSYNINVILDQTLQIDLSELKSGNVDKKEHSGTDYHFENNIRRELRNI